MGQKRHTPEQIIQKLIDLIRAVAEAVGVEPEIVEEPMQPGDVPRTYADITNTKELLGWEPQTSLAEGIGRYVEWIKGQWGQLRLVARGLRCHCAGTAVRAGSDCRCSRARSAASPPLPRYPPLEP